MKRGGGRESEAEEEEKEEDEGRGGGGERGKEKKENLVRFEMYMELKCILKKIIKCIFKITVVKEDDKQS